MQKKRREPGDDYEPRIYADQKVTKNDAPNCQTQEHPTPIIFPSATRYGVHGKDEIGLYHFYILAAADQGCSSGKSSIVHGILVQTRSLSVKPRGDGTNYECDLVSNGMKEMARRCRQDKYSLTVKRKGLRQ